MIAPLVLVLKEQYRAEEQETSNVQLTNLAALDHLLQPNSVAPRAALVGPSSSLAGGRCQ